MSNSANFVCRTASSGMVAALALLWSAPGFAQQSQGDAGSPPAVPSPGGRDTAIVSSNAGDIIVTARRREESILNVPVIETAVTGETLTRYNVTSTEDLPRLVPGLVIGRAQGPVGMLVSIRGIGAISNDQGVDSSISLNIDGLQLNNSVAFEAGLFDLGLVEVLKGPQALFYGKSSPGGVISLRSADPTDKTELILRTSYEFEARNPRIEAIASGPVTDTLKLRLAAAYDASAGWFYNTAVAIPQSGALQPTHNRAPFDHNAIVRGTALWNPTSDLDVRLKVNYSHDASVFPQAAQLSSCPDGVATAPFGLAFTANDDCILNRKVGVVYIDPAFYPGDTFGSVPKITTDQHFGTLELNYHPLSAITLTSLTAYYKLHQTTLLNATNSTGFGASLIVPITFQRREITQEFRANSNFGGPLNFTAGAYYEDGQINNRVALIYNRLLANFASDVREIVDIKTYSLFGQARWTITPSLELDAGVRWTDETRTEDAFNPAATNTPVSVAIPRIHSANWSPEATLSFRPTDDLNLFASYKQAFKSGSFGLGGIPTNGSDSSFGDEKVRGGEVGTKGRLFDRSLVFNLAAYYYKFHGLQVGAVEPPRNGFTETRTLNAGAARVYGVDLDLTYVPRGIDGLTLNGSITWNKSRYLSLANVPCWGGQTIAEGCNGNFNAGTGLYTTQDLSGTSLVRAPVWQGQAGFSYEVPIGGNLALLVSNNNTVSSKFRTFLAIGRPNDDQFQQSYVKIDVNLSLKQMDDRWQISLIGKNLTNKITTSNCNASNSANGALGGEITGGTARGIAGIDEIGCNTEVGRQLFIKLETRF